MDRTKHNIVSIYVITVFQALIFAYVIERVFGESRGLSVLEMQYLLILYSMFSILFEVPAGVVADIWKKKYTLALGVAFCSFEFFISIFSYNFSMISLVYLAAALGGSLKSGTLESILYETLKDQNKESAYVQISGRLKFIKYSVSGVAAIVGGFIADHFGYEMNYWLSLIGFPIVIVLILNLYEPSDSKPNIKKIDFSTFLLHMKKGFNRTWRKRPLRNVILVSGVVGAVLYGQLHEMSMLIYPELGIRVIYFGFVSLGIMVIAALSGFLSTKIKQELQNPYFISLTYLVPSISIIIFGTASHWWGVLFLIAAIGILEALTPVYSGLIQDESPDELRVTISSIAAFFHNSISILIGLLFGYLTKWFSIHVSFQVLGVILLILLFVKLNPSTLKQWRTS